MKSTRIYTLLLMLCVALSFGFSANAQQVVQIGTGTNSPTITLLSPMYRYSATSSTKGNKGNILFTEQELQTAGIAPGTLITALAFNKTDTNYFTSPTAFEIYMGNSSKVAPLATTTRWDTLMNNQSLMYSGNVVLSNVAGWVTFNFNTPFFYTGGGIEIATAHEQAVAGSTGPIKWEYSDNTAPYVIGNVSQTNLVLNNTAAVYKHRPNVRFTTQSPASNDMAVVQLESPVDFCAGNNNVVVKIENRGSNTVNSVVVNWSINNVLQTPVTITTPLASILTGSNSNTTVNLGNFNFPIGSTDLKIWTSNPNNANDANNANDTIAVSVKPQLSGVYTVNPALPVGGTNYATIAAIADDLNTLGVCGPVTVNVSPVAAGYNTKIEFKDIPGASAVNRIRINGNGALLNPSTSTTNGSREAVLLDGTKYLTIDSFLIRPSGTSGGWGILLTGGAMHDSILNSSIELLNFNTTAAAATNGIVVSGNNSSPTATAVGATDIVIKGNKIKGAIGSGGVYYGISLGNGGNNNISVLNNEIENYYSAGIYFGTASNILIADNNIHRTNKDGGFTTNYGIQSATGVAKNVIIERNRIHSVASATATYSSTTYGIWMLTDADSTEPNIVRNNLIYNFRGNQTYGIGLSIASYTHIYANTINIDQASTGTSAQAGIYATGNNEGSNIKNNIVSITNSNLGNIYGFYYNANTVIGDAQHNNFYVNSANTGTASQNYGYNGAAFPNLAAFQTAFPTLEINGTDVDPQYNNPTALDYTPNNPLLIFTGADLATAVTTDFLSQARGVPPTVGAFEKIVARVYDLATAALVRPIELCMGVDSIIVNVANVGGLNVDSFTVNWSLDNVLQTPIVVRQRLNSIINPTGKDVDVNLGAHTFGTAPVALKVWVSNPNNAPDTFNMNDTLEATLQARLGGTYTVNPALAASNTNFVSIASFAERLSAVGVCGPVVVNVVPGAAPFVGKLEFTTYPGASAINTVRINGNGNTVSVATAATNGNREIVLLRGVSYLTIDSLNFVSTGVAGWGALITGASTYDSFTNCTFDLSIITATAANSNSGIVISGANSSATTAGLAGANLYFGNNTFLSSAAAGGMYYGIAIATGGNDSIVIENNKFNNIYSTGVYVNAASGVIVRGNIFDRSTKTTGFTTYSAVQTLGAGSGIVIEKNIIRNFTDPTATTTSTAYGLNIQADADATAPNIVRNNVIHTLRGSTLYGIYVTTAAETKILNNTIHLDVVTNNTGINAGIYTTGTNANLEVKNNNIVINGGGTVNNYGFYYASAASVKDAQKNNVYINSTATGAKNYGYYTKIFRDKASFNNDYPLLEVNSPEVDPVFVNAAIGDYKPNHHLLQFNGVNVINDVTDDILSVNRSVAPTIGAYEEVPSFNNDLAVMAITKPFAPMCADSQDVYAVVTNVGLNPVTSFTINMTYDGGNTISTNHNVTLDTISATGNFSDTFFVGRVLMDGLDKEVKVWTSNPNGQVDARITNDELTNELSTTEFYITTINDTVCVGASVKATFYPQKDINDGDLEWYESNDGINYNVIAGANNLDLYYNNVTATKYIKAKYVANGNNCETAPIIFTPLDAQIYSISDTAVCKFEDAYLVAKASPGAKVLWFSDSTSLSPIGIGDTLRLSEVEDTKFYYAQAGIYDTVYRNVGPVTPPSIGANASINSTVKVFFDVNAQLNLKSVDVFATVASTATGEIIITDELTNQVVGTYPYTITNIGINNPNTVAIDVVLPPGKYSMNRTTASPNLVRNSSGAVYPYGNKELSITGNATSATTTTFINFYNWQYEMGCSTPRINNKVEVYPTPLVDLGRDINECKNADEAIVLDAQNPGFLFQWDDNSTNATRTVNRTGTYYVKAYNQYGCNHSDTININIKPNPVSALGSDTSVCIDLPIELNAGRDGIRYYWNTGHTANSITATDSGEYVVFITGNNGCIITDTVNIAYNGLSPKVDGIQIRNRGPRTFQFNTINPQNVVGYEWDFGDGSPRSTDANPTHEYTGTGNFTVKCYISSTCGTFYDTMSVHIFSTSVNNIDNSQKITVYPNPTTDKVNVKVDDVNVKIQRIIIMNILGQSIEQNEFKTPQNEVLINLSNLSAGTYQLFVETTNGTTIEKVIKTQ